MAVTPAVPVGISVGGSFPSPSDQSQQQVHHHTPSQYHPHHHLRGAPSFPQQHHPPHQHRHHPYHISPDGATAGPLRLPSVLGGGIAAAPPSSMLVRTQMTPYGAIPEGWAVEEPIRRQKRLASPTQFHTRKTATVNMEGAPGGLLGGFLMRMAGLPQNFSVQLRCFSMLYFPKGDADKIDSMNYGGNIHLPNSALDALTRLNVQYPLLFKLASLNPERQRVTHAGVLEFMAEEGRCYLPTWMMRQLLIDDGELIAIESTSLPSATYAKVKPMSTDFLTAISNPRAILEVELRKFRCLTKGDVFAIKYNNQVLEFKVMDLRPVNAVSITECDVNLEFDTPEGYVEPTPRNTTGATWTAVMPEAPPDPHPGVARRPNEFVPFSGEARRLDGRPAGDTSRSRTTSTSLVADVAGSSGSGGGGGSKTLGSSASSSSMSRLESSISAMTPTPVTAASPALAGDESYQPGALRFVRYNYKSRATLEREELERLRDGAEKEGGGAGGNAGSSTSGAGGSVDPFSGVGHRIRAPKKK